MKKLMLLALLLWGAGNLYAQRKTVEKTLAMPASQKVNLKLKFGNDVKVTAWGKKEAYVKATYEINGGKLNEAFLLTFNEGKDQLNVTADLDEKLLKNSTYEGNCDGGATTTFGNYENGKVKNGVCTRIDYEIFLPREANLTLETINGDIELRGFSGGTVNAKSISGFVDMDWSNQKGATIALKTITGEVYSDVAIDLTEKQKEAPIVGYQLKGNVNNGGPRIQLETISNNIYFRKKK